MLLFFVVFYTRWRIKNSLICWWCDAKSSSSCGVVSLSEVMSWMYCVRVSRDGMGRCGCVRIVGYDSVKDGGGAGGVQVGCSCVCGSARANGRRKVSVGMDVYCMGEGGGEVHEGYRVQPRTLLKGENPFGKDCHL